MNYIRMTYLHLECVTPAIMECGGGRGMTQYKYIPCPLYCLGDRLTSLSEQGYEVVRVIETSEYHSNILVKRV